MTSDKHSDAELVSLPVGWSVKFHFDFTWSVSHLAMETLKVPL